MTVTKKEFELLAALVGAPGRVFERRELLDLIWGRGTFVGPRTVDVHVARLKSRFRLAKLLPPQSTPYMGSATDFGTRPPKPQHRRSFQATPRQDSGSHPGTRLQPS